DMVLGKICDPYLHLFSGVKSLRRSSLDLTPVLALVLLNFVRSVLGMFAEIGSLSVWVILAILINALWRSLFSFLLFLLIVLLIVRFFLGRSTSPSASNWINTIDPILDPSVNRVYKLFYKKKQVDDQKIVLVSTIFYVVVLVVTSIAVNKLVDFLVRL
ncbi:MAG: YggT family protein, partial [Spirochaetales bacterium]|nr:YggT family protein [Spirochaetales bacterium]